MARAGALTAASHRRLPREMGLVKLRSSNPAGCQMLVPTPIYALSDNGLQQNW